MSRVFLFLCSALPFFIACQSTQEVDLLFYGGTIHTLDSSASNNQCLLVQDGKILAIGSEDSLRSLYRAKQEINLQGKHLYPAWHDAHAHFASTGKGLREVQLRGLNSWEDCLQEISNYIQANPDKKWIIGRGWDQNLWGGVYPSRFQLDSLYPEHNFFLSRVDGHAALVSGNVLELLDYTTEIQIDGGALLRDGTMLTGVLIDAAADKAKEILPEPSYKEWREALLAAQDLFLDNGVAAITEAGLPLELIMLLDSMQKEGSLKMKFVAMLNPNEKEFQFAKEQGIYETPQLKVASFKLYADGALGSRGALLKVPYCDHNGRGLAIHDPVYFDSICAKIDALGFQANTHCIGDSANRLILETYAKYLKGKNDKRWRIEHAQVIDLADLQFFGDNSILPSVQPTHATSDMPWAQDRLCEGRMRGAYAYKSLLEQVGIMPLGTDAPVENINPIQTFISAVFRVNEKQEPAGGFEVHEALTRIQALKGMTEWAAYAGKTDHLYGKLAVGLAADFVIYQQDLEKDGLDELLGILPQGLWVDGVKLK